MWHNSRLEANIVFISKWHSEIEKLLLKSRCIPSMLIPSILQIQSLFDIHCACVWKIINLSLPHCHTSTWTSPNTFPLLRWWATYNKINQLKDSSAPQVETFSVSSTSQEHPFVCRKLMLLPAHSWYFNCWPYLKKLYTTSASIEKLGGSSSPQVETFSVSKTLTLSQERSFVCRKWMLLPARS